MDRDESYTLYFFLESMMQRNRKNHCDCGNDSIFPECYARLEDRVHKPAVYRESGWSPSFYREHKADIEAHKEAQAVYSAADGKLPTLAELSEEYELLLSQKRQTGEELSRLSEELKNLRHIKSNMDMLLDDARYDADRHRHNELNPSERDWHAIENTR